MTVDGIYAARSARSRLYELCPVVCDLDIQPQPAPEPEAQPQPPIPIAVCQELLSSPDDNIAVVRLLLFHIDKLVGNISCKKKLFDFFTHEQRIV